MSQLGNHHQQDQVWPKTTLPLKISRSCPVIGKWKHPSLKTGWGGGGEEATTGLDYGKQIFWSRLEYNAFALGLVKAKFLFTV